MNSKKFNLILFTILLLASSYQVKAQSTDPVNTLIGKWKLDMTPQDPNDSNFSYMEIIKIKNGEVSGWFYREGVNMRFGRYDDSTGVPYIALVSGDNSGDYNTTMKLVNGRLEGTTHALKREFIAFWVAEKQD